MAGQSGALGRLSQQSRTGVSVNEHGLGSMALGTTSQAGHTEVQPSVDGEVRAAALNFMQVRGRVRVLCCGLSVRDAAGVCGMRRREGALAELGVDLWAHGAKACSAWLSSLAQSHSYHSAQPNCMQNVHLYLSPGGPFVVETPSTSGVRLDHAKTMPPVCPDPQNVDLTSFDPTAEANPRVSKQKSGGLLSSLKRMVGGRRSDTGAGASSPVGASASREVQAAGGAGALSVDPARPDHTKVLQRFLKDLVSGRGAAGAGHGAARKTGRNHVRDIRETGHREGTVGPIAVCRLGSMSRLCSTRMAASSTPFVVCLFAGPRQLDSGARGARLRPEAAAHHRRGQPRAWQHAGDLPWPRPPVAHAQHAQQPQPAAHAGGGGSVKPMRLGLGGEGVD